MKRTLQGHYEILSTVGEKDKAFASSPLPPSPPIVWTPALRERFDDALLALGRLDSVSTSSLACRWRTFAKSVIM